jgi:hypothetical protein
MPNRKHVIGAPGQEHETVKDWMRANPQEFGGRDIDTDVPTSEEIGVVLQRLGYVREETVTHVIYHL